MAFDCDDADAMTYPGAAEMDSETACLTDADEDGYGASTKFWLLTLFLETDSLGDDWNGGTYIDVLVEQESLQEHLLLKVLQTVLSSVQ